MKKKADREDDGIKQNSFLIKQSNKITVEKKAERNENLKAAEKISVNSWGNVSVSFSLTEHIIFEVFPAKVCLPKRKAISFGYAPCVGSA